MGEPTNAGQKRPHLQMAFKNGLRIAQTPFNPGLRLCGTQRENNSDLAKNPKSGWNFGPTYTKVPVEKQ